MVSALGHALKTTLLPDKPVETGEAALDLAHVEEGQEPRPHADETPQGHSEYISRLPQPQPFIVRPESEEAEEARADWVDFNAPSGSPDR
jgi:hypothetical protein